MAVKNELIIQLNEKKISKIYKLKKEDCLNIFINKKIGDIISFTFENIKKNYKITGGSTINGVPLYKSVNGTGTVYVNKFNSKKKKVHSNLIDNDIKALCLVEIDGNKTDI